MSSAHPREGSGTRPPLATTASDKSEGVAPTNDASHRPRRRTFSEKTKELFRKKPGDKNEAPPIPAQTLAYQPRLKTASSQTPLASETVPEEPHKQTGPPSLTNSPAHRPSRQLAPLDVAASHNAFAVSPASASATPRAMNSIAVVDNSGSATPTKATIVETPVTPRPSSSGSGKPVPSPEQHHHFRHPFHRPLTKPRLLQSHRKASADLSTANAVGEIDTGTLPLGAAFPVAPSYHERAHPSLQPPKVAFSLIDGPASHEEPFTTKTLPPPRLQRPAIKVKIITWNMGGASLPKGDLEVLLGRVGGYVPPEEDWDLDDAEGVAWNEGVDEEGARRRSSNTRGKGIPGQEGTPRHERIPPLPHDDGHPYHLLVVAGQECPWGDGKRIATGIGVAGELSDLTRSKSKATHLSKSKEKSGEGHNGAAVPQTPAGFGTGADTPAGGSDGFPFGSPPPTAGPSGNVPAGAPATHGGGRVFGGKGWSDMCEDWLCRGPAAQSKATKGLAATTEALVSGHIGPSQEGSRNPSRAPSPCPSSREASSSVGASRSTSPVMGSSPPKPTTLANARRGSAVSASLNIPALPSFGRTASTGLLGGEAQSSPPPLTVPSLPVVRDYGASPTTPLSPPPPVPLQKPAPSSNLARQGLQIKIPGQSDEIDGTPLSLGAYELLVKERCAMIYMAVYCWRGCRDRVRGFDRAHVKSGLLAGRVGNKGAVGISVKLGQTRMLFVNSHLAAHEGKIQTRLDNIAKIKKELRLDTFLPTEDPTNKLADVTGMYDHSFWCGDLNFRVDITRQHADWLIMNKRYDQALEFDQLRKVMKEGREFQNFREHDISFPPTYKYDVLKTLKKPKRDRTVRRILRRRGHTASSAVAATFAGNETDEDPDETRATAADADETMDTNRSGATKRASMISLQDGEDETDDDDDASSASSIGPWGGSVGSSGFTGPPSESEHSGPSDVSSPIDPVVSSNTTAASGAQIFSHGAAIKAKWRFMDFVRTATGANEGQEKSSKASKRKSKDVAAAMPTRSTSATSSPITPTSTRSGSSASNVHKSRQASGPAPAAALPTPIQSTQTSPSKKSDPTVAGSSQLQRQMSQTAASSAPVLSPDGVNGLLVRRDSQGSLDFFGGGAETTAGVDSESTIDVGGAPPVTPPITHDDMVGTGAGGITLPKTSPSKNGQTIPKRRRRSSAAGDLEGVFKRSESSGKIGVATAAAGTKEKTPAAASESQPYDTSAKQRVPSWTDRILWRTNVKPKVVGPTLATIGERGEQQAREVVMDGAGAKLGKSLGSALRGAGGVLVSTVHGGAGSAPAAVGEKRSVTPSRSQTFSHPVNGSTGRGSAMPTTAPAVGAAASSNTSSWRRRGSMEGPSSASADVPSRTASPANGSPRDSPTSASAAVKPWMRPRRTFSADHDISCLGDGQNGRRSGTNSPRMSMLRLSSRPGTPDGGSESPRGGGAGRDSRPSTRATTRDSAIGSRRSPSADYAARRAFSGNVNRSPSPPGGGGGARRLSSWWATHIPTILTAQGAAAAFASLTSSNRGGVGASEAKVKSELEIIGPRRGEVECLLYKSLDDGEMRALEGRSDHRPVIFVGSIGI